MAATHYYEYDVVNLEGSSYVCKLEHDATWDSRPGTGASWETYWQLLAEKGDQGVEGDPGIIGSQIYTDDGAPSDTLGVNGDFYLNNLNGDYYKKAAGTWGSPQGNLTPGSGETNTASNLGGGVGVYEGKSAVDLQFNSLSDDQFSETSNVISLIVAAPAPDYTPPAIKYYDADEITIPAEVYYPLGHRLDGQYQVKNYVPWDVAAAFQVDVDGASLVGGDTPSAWYSVFMTSASTVLILPFVRPNAVNFSVDKTELYPAEHNNGTTANTTFVNANDCFNTYRLMLLTMGTYHGNIYTILDTVNDASDKILITGDVSAEIAAGQWLQMIPPAGTDCLYLGTIRLKSTGDLMEFTKRGWLYEYNPTISVTANGHASTLANTEVGPAIPPTAATAAFHYLAGQNGGAGVASVDLQIAYGLTGSLDTYGKGYMNMNTWDSLKRYAACFPAKVMTAVSKIRNLARGWSNVPEPDAYVACQLATMYFWGWGE